MLLYYDLPLVPFGKSFLQLLCPVFRRYKRECQLFSQYEIAEKEHAILRIIGIDN